MIDHYIVDTVTRELDAGTIAAIEGAERYFDVIEGKFPVGLNRIDWERHPQARIITVFRDELQERHSDETALALSRVRDVVAGWFAAAEIDLAQSVVWIGDNTDMGLEMSAACLLEVFPKLFSFPQHSYGLPKDGAWCLNYVMEGELFFGIADDRGSTTGAGARDRIHETEQR